MLIYYYYKYNIYFIINESWIKNKYYNKVIFVNIENKKLRKGF